MGAITDLVNAVKLSQKDAPVSDILIGLHWTMVTSNHTGLAATNSDAPCCNARDIEYVGHLLERSVFELIELVYSTHPLEVSVGMAALNSVIESDNSCEIEYNARDILLEKCENRNVVVIGHFPFADLFKEKAKNTWILELNPGPGDIDASEAVNLIPKADIIGLTATTLMNGTFDNLAEIFPSHSFVVMMGPSTPMSPRLFDYGIDILAGSKVADPAKLKQFIGQGSTLHKVDGLRRITIAKDLQK
jgi:uncharacterized protein (DUF4213/DUF364 family)